MHLKPPAFAHCNGECKDIGLFMLLQSVNGVSETFACPPISICVASYQREAMTETHQDVHQAPVVMALAKSRTMTMQVPKDAKRAGDVPVP